MKINYSQVSSVPVNEEKVVHNTTISRTETKYEHPTTYVPTGGFIVEHTEWIKFEGRDLTQGQTEIPDELTVGSPVDYPSELQKGELIVLTGENIDIVYPLRVSVLKKDVANRGGPTALTVETATGKEYYLYRKGEEEYKLTTRPNSSFKGLSVTVHPLPTIYSISMLENKEKITEFGMVYSEACL